MLNERCVLFDVFCFYDMYFVCCVCDHRVGVTFVYMYVFYVVCLCHVLWVLLLCVSVFVCCCVV